MSDHYSRRGQRRLIKRDQNEKIARITMVLQMKTLPDVQVWHSDCHVWGWSNHPKFAIDATNSDFGLQLIE